MKSYISQTMLFKDALQYRANFLQYLENNIQNSLKDNIKFQRHDKELQDKNFFFLICFFINKKKKNIKYKKFNFFKIFFFFLYHFYSKQLNTF
jgi:hypothetical protein